MPLPHPAVAAAAAAIFVASLPSCGKRDADPPTGPETGGVEIPPPPPAPAVSPLLSSASTFERALADSPIHWNTWGEDAFALAKKHRRPVYLHIGYPACPWCSKMKNDAFVNKEIISLLNTDFVPIVVDAETYPEVNRVFMAYLRAAKKNSGWPLNVFITPEGAPMSAAAFMTSDGNDSNPGFLSVAKHISNQWQQFPDHYAAQTKLDLAPLVKTYGKQPTSALIRPSKEFVDQVFARIGVEFDPLSGGFNAQPKFLFGPRLEFLLHYGSQADTKEDSRRRALAMVSTTLDNASGSAICDDLSGGFFRYSTDAFWNGPNFEKHLIDQAVNAAVFARAYESLQKPKYRDVFYRILDYADTTLRSPDGAYFQSQATGAGKPGTARENGIYYTWSFAELNDILGPDGVTAASKIFGLRSRGNFPNSSLLHSALRGRNVIIPPVAGSDETEVQAIREKLLTARNARLAPDLDTSVHLTSNAYMALALARGGRVFSDPALTARAEELLGTLRRTHCGGTPIPRVRIRLGEIEGPPPTAADYAAVIAAYLEIHRTTGDEKWLADAVATQEAQTDLFYDTNGRGFFSTTDPGQLFLQIKSVIDSSVCSVNSRSALNLITLSSATSDQKFRKQAWETLYGLSPFYKNAPANSPTMIEALSVLLATAPGDE